MTKEEAIKIIKDWKGFLNSSIEEALKILIPELRESEDELTRQEMIAVIRSISSDCQFAIYLTNDQKQRYLAWLEKKKESLHITESCKENDNSFTDDEDERIRKEILHYFNIELLASEDKKDKEILEEWIAYLEEQKEQKPVKSIFPPGLGEAHFNPTSVVEQKPAEWDKTTINEMVLHYACTEQEGIGKPVNCMVKAYRQGISDILKKINPSEWSEEEKIIANALEQLYSYADSWHNGNNDTRAKEVRKVADELKSLRPIKQEWSEEDERMVKFYDDDYNNRIGNMPMKDVVEMRLKFNDWVTNRIKSLRPQPHWKPSEEQVEALGRNLGGNPFLVSLYNDLLKLNDMTKTDHPVDLDKTNQ